ncbi:MAG: hemolysin family protein [Candidatus Dormiibacterota bacterium]
MTAWMVVVLVVTLVVASLAATAETALTSVSRLRLRARREEGDPKAILIERLHANPGGYLSTILVLNTVAVVLASSAATLLAENHFGPDAAFWASLALSVLVLIFCEIGPKAYALQHNETVADLMARPVELVTVVLRPLVVVLTSTSSLLTRLLPGERGRRTPFLSEAELKALVTASTDEGVVEEEEREMIHGVLEMTDKMAREVMVPRVQVVALPVDATLDEAVELVLERGHSRIPVYHETIDNVTGILYAKDLLKVWRGDSQARVGPLTRPATFVPEAKRLGELLQEMQLAKVHMVVVVDEYGGTAGVVTIEDVLEEIVGPIRDEYDLTEREEIQIISPTEAVLSGSASLDDANDILRLQLSGEDFDSVGGLVYSLLGRIPAVGDEVDAGDGITLRVEAIDRQAIRTVRLFRERGFDAPALGADSTPAEERVQGGSAPS